MLYLPPMDPQAVRNHFLDIERNSSYAGYIPHLISIGSNVFFLPFNMHILKIPFKWLNVEERDMLFIASCPWLTETTDSVVICAVLLVKTPFEDLAVEAIDLPLDHTRV